MCTIVFDVYDRPISRRLFLGLESLLGKIVILLKGMASASHEGARFYISLNESCLLRLGLHFLVPVGRSQPLASL